MWEYNHLVHRSQEQKEFWHIFGKKFDWFQTGRSKCQHHATYPNMVYKLGNNTTQHVKNSRTKWKFTSTIISVRKLSASWDIVY